MAIGLDEGVATVRIGRYETGVHEPSFMVMERIARVLNVPTPYLYSDDDVLAGAILLLGRMTGETRVQAMSQLEVMLTADQKG